MVTPASRSSADGRPGVMQLVLSLMPGGTERLVIDLVTRLSPRFRMVVCCLDEKGDWAHEVTALGVPVVALQRLPGFHPSLGARVARMAAEHRVNLIHCHHYSPFVYGRIAALVRPQLRLVFTEHGRLSDDSPKLKRRIANAVLGRLPAAMFSVSSDLKAHMVAEGFPAGRLGVIHNGVDPRERLTATDRIAARARLGIAADAFLIGTAARLDPVKDLGTLVAATARLRTQQVRAQLVIAGEGPERPALESAIQQQGLAGIVQLLGYRPDVRELLPGLDVFVNSSISEGISLTVLEAMAAGLPVVATRVGGTPEVVVHGTTGLLVGARSDHDLAAALLELASSPERRSAMGTAGRRRLEEQFTIERMVDQYSREYTRLEHR